jgi:hypothetical protein
MLEGIVQALASSGHRSHVIRSLADAATTLGELRPLVTLVERGCAGDAEFLRLRLPPGSTLVLYRHHDQAPAWVPASVQRLTVADLVLPLERQRLVTIVQRLAERAVATGRGTDDAPSEDRAR